MTTPSQVGPGGAGPDERLLRAELVIGALDNGIAVIGTDLAVWWANDAFRKWCPGDPIGRSFFEALNTPPDARPSDDAFHAALAGSPACLRVRQASNLLLDVTVSPVRELSWTMPSPMDLADAFSGSTYRSWRMVQN